MPPEGWSTLFVLVEVGLLIAAMPPLISWVVQARHI